jgi:hypothetical protein
VDLQLYLRVLWRFRLLVTAGLLLATTLALLSFVRVEIENGSPSLVYRESELWMSRSTLWVTREGFPIGRLQSEESGQPTADFSGLAGLYSALAQSDAVRAIMLRDGPLNGSVEVRTPRGEDRDAQPFLVIEAVSPRPADAMELAGRQKDALIQYVRQEQDADGIPERQRVVLKVLAQPRPPELVDPRSFTRPVVLFVTAMIAVLGLAFILENLRPRTRAVSPGEPQATASAESSRRSA